MIEANEGQLHRLVLCPECGGKGEVDSGGQTPWDCENTVFHDAVENGEEQSHDQCPRCRAKIRWNNEADVHNQWDALGEDEKLELAEHEANAKDQRRP